MLTEVLGGVSKILCREQTVIPYYNAVLACPKPYDNEACGVVLTYP